MFVIVQLPLADMRPLIPGQLGRLPRPDWRADSISEGFIRGFGKIAPRTQSSLALRGERAYADCNNAIRFMQTIALKQETLPKPLYITPWFRRLYYDGEISGRFEFGFLAKDDDEDLVFRLSNDAGINPAELGRSFLSTLVQIRSVDGSQTDTTLADCAEPLGLAYLSATTDNAKIASNSPKEIYGHYVKIGSPIIHARISSGRYIETSRDKRLLSVGGEPAFFLTSPRGAGTRNGIIVQSSYSNSLDETNEERVVRVLFAHLNSVLFAHAHFAAQSNETTNSRRNLRAVIKGMLERLARFSPTHSDNQSDEALHEALQLFSSANEGRLDDLCEKLNAIATKMGSPTWGENIVIYAKSLHELAVKATIDAMVKTTMKP